MSALDLAIVGLYVVAILALGAAISRRIRSFRDYFIAAGRMTAPLLICTLVSTYYGLDVLFGGSEVAYQEGLVAFFVYTRPYYLAILVAGLFIARRLRRHDFLSLPDVAAHFYGNATRAVVAVASAFYALPLMAVMGLGILLNVVLGLPFAWGVLLGAAVSLAYTLLGGLLADALTDTIQFTLMCVALGVAAVLALQDAGGVDALRDQVPASYFGSTGTYPVSVLIVFAGAALSVLVEPAFYQRIYAAASYPAVLVAMLAGIVLWASFDWITTILGIAAAAAGIETEPRYALLTLTLDILPTGLKGLFVAGVLATAMSTIDSYLLIAGGNLAYDLYRPLRRPDMDDRTVLRLTRWMIALSAAACVALALFFRSIVSAWIFMSTVLIAAALVPLMGALYAPWRPTRAAGLASSLAGLGSAVAYFVAVHWLGHYDAERATQIWTIELGSWSADLWQEHALLLALPAAVLAYAAGQIFGPVHADRSGSADPTRTATRSPPARAGAPIQQGDEP